MTTSTTSRAIFADAPPIPTQNPVGDVELAGPEDRPEPYEAETDLIAALLARLKSLLSYARGDRSQVS